MLISLLVVLAYVAIVAVCLFGAYVMYLIAVAARMSRDFRRTLDKLRGDQ